MPDLASPITIGDYLSVREDCCGRNNTQSNVDGNLNGEIQRRMLVWIGFTRIKNSKPFRTGVFQNIQVVSVERTAMIEQARDSYLT